jgi:putative ABC transport system ATP-binding protein
VLEARELKAGYGGEAVVELPPLRLDPGEAALMLGPSGSGKTSLLLAIAGLVEILGGSVTIDGADIGAMSPSQRDRFRGRRIGLIFQDLHLISGLSTLDNLLLAPFAASRPQDAERAVQLLTQLGLDRWAHRPAETLSRGQAQRVAIARAMLMRPSVILADEPTASLDDAACLRAAELLFAAARETGAALLIASHDQRLKPLVSKAVTVTSLGALAA